MKNENDESKFGANMNFNIVQIFPTLSRRDLVGYTGYKLMDENIMAAMERDMAHPNPAMESTTQAVHK